MPASSVATQPTSTAGLSPHTSATLTTPPAPPAGGNESGGDMASFKSGLDNLVEQRANTVHDTPGRRQQTDRANRDRIESPAPTKTATEPEKPTPAEEPDPLSELNEFLGRKPSSPAPEKKPGMEIKAEPGDEAVEQEFTKGPAQLREAYQKLKSQLKTDKEQYEKRLAETQKQAGESKTLTEQLAKLQKERDEYENKIRFLDFEQSAEYETRYKKPLASAYDLAQREVSQLYVETDQGRRPATQDDFDAVVRLNTGDAIAKARELFGDAATEVLGQRRKILDLAEQSRSARDEYRGKGLEQRKAQEVEMQMRREKLTSLWEHQHAELASKHPRFFGLDDTDAEGNGLLEEGTKLADLAFKPMDGLSDEQKVALHAQVRNRAAAFPRMASRWLKGENQIKILKAKLAAYEGSTPGRGGGQPNGSPQPKQNDTLQSVLDGLDRLV